MTFSIELLPDDSYVVVETTDDGAKHQHPTRFASAEDAVRYCVDNAFPLS